METFLICQLCVLSLMSTFAVIDQDFMQTKMIVANNGLETNPLLGSHPSLSQLNFYQTIFKISLFAFNLIPMEDRWKISLNKSFQFTEELTTQQNGNFNQWPPAIGLVWSWNF